MVKTEDIQDLDSNLQDNFNISLGGHWKPPDCYARHRVAIIIPFRDRASHLSTLLSYLHPLLQRQLLEYRIFVVEQVSTKSNMSWSKVLAKYIKIPKAKKIIQVCGFPTDSDYLLFGLIYIGPCVKIV